MVPIISFVGKHNRQIVYYGTNSELSAEGLHPR